MSQLQLETPDDLLRMQLRVARTMEDDSLAALGELAEAAESADIKKLFRHHADETQQQIENLRKVFQILELPESTAASPVTKGIGKHAESLIARSAKGLRDQVTLSAALGNEHYEMAAYEALITPLTALGATDAVKLLEENREQEIHTSEELSERLRQLVQG
ncbi:ferritin-like domain-containing protein [Microbacterium sp. Marseille-Q6965]|uniref:YciE/YciF ferroxidase family protein n=1 Tax=Microbacterium sp. Marseille-Q6965 TaxID=2965072 RepID=UPI0021B83651|nr:ferritin-like domain-containing protein [Microbacterium sp. Marseille-Q6965]